MMTRVDESAFWWFVNGEIGETQSRKVYSGDTLGPNGAPWCARRNMRRKHMHNSEECRQDLPDVVVAATQGTHPVLAAIRRE